MRKPKKRVAYKVTAPKNTGRPSLGYEDLFYYYGGKPMRGDDGWMIYFGKTSLGVTVTRKHIDAGLPESPTECVMGLAVSDFFNNKYVVEVGRTVVRITDEKGKRELRFSVPLALRRRLGLFDVKSVWTLPPSVYRLHAMQKPNKRIKPLKGKSTKPGKGGSLTLVGRPGGQKPKVKNKKPRAVPTRIIDRGRIVRSPVVKSKRAG